MYWFATWYYTRAFQTARNQHHHYAAEPASSKAASLQCDLHYYFSVQTAATCLLFISAVVSLSYLESRVALSKTHDIVLVTMARQALHDVRSTRQLGY
jgi:hypothetical protein